MTTQELYSVNDAMVMMLEGGVDLKSELSNIKAAYADITDEIEQAGGEPNFGLPEFRQALIDATKN